MNMKYNAKCSTHKVSQITLKSCVEKSKIKLLHAHLGLSMACLVTTMADCPGSWSATRRTNMSPGFNALVENDLPRKLCGHFNVSETAVE